MYQNRMKRMMAEGQIPTGMKMISDSTMIAEVIAQSGIDYVVIETEHGPLSPMVHEPLATLCKIYQSYQVTPLVRITENDRLPIGKVLDAGAMGVIVPHIKTKEDAINMVKATRFPPEGIRGTGPLVPANRIIGAFDDYLKNTNAEIMAVPQIEDIEGVENFEEIAEVEGISFVQVVHEKIGFSMGIDDYMSPEIDAARQRVFDICRDKGIPVQYGGSAQDIQAALEQGMKIVTSIAADVRVLHEACQTKVKAVKAAIAEASKVKSA